MVGQIQKKIPQGHFKMQALCFLNTKETLNQSRISYVNLTLTHIVLFDDLITESHNSVKWSHFEPQHHLNSCMVNALLLVRHLLRTFIGLSCNG